MGMLGMRTKSKKERRAELDREDYQQIANQAGNTKQTGAQIQKQDKVYGISKEEYTLKRRNSVQLGGNPVKYYGDVRESLMRNVEMRKQSEEIDLRKESEKNIAGVTSQKVRAGRKIGTGRSASLMAALEGKSTRYRGI